jgi:hypothetical protein
VRDEFRVRGTAGEIDLSPLNGPELVHPGGNVFIMDSVAPNSLVIYDGLDMRVMNKADKKTAVDFQI